MDMWTASAEPDPHIHHPDDGDAAHLAAEIRRDLCTYTERRRLSENRDSRVLTNRASIVTSGNRGVSGNGYLTMAEAVSWCENQAAQFIASDSRFKDSEAGT